MNNYDVLIQRLDSFVRRYYANQLLRGLLVLLSGLLAYVLAISLGEYFLYLPVWIKLPLVAVFVLLALIALIFWVLVPVAKMFRLGKLISHEEAAYIIGAHFPEVSDQLLNVLQLKQQECNAASRQLIEASIGQKIKKISVVPIVQAVDLSQNKKYLPYLIPLLGIALLILGIAPQVFRDAGARLLQPTKEFVKPAPFRYQIQSEPLSVLRNADYVLRLQVVGAALPAQVSVLIGDDEIPMRALAAHQFEYMFKNCTEELRFRLYAAGYKSEEYVLKVLQKPLLIGMEQQIVYPAYTGRKNEVRKGLSDILVPQGTEITWRLEAQYADQLSFQWGDGTPSLLKKEDRQYVLKQRLMADTFYTVHLYNQKSRVTERFGYRTQVIPDQYPVVQVEEFKDTVSGTQLVLNGAVGDDYGLSKLQFNYQILDEQNKILSSKSAPIKINSGTASSFQYYFDIGALGLLPGQQLQYYVAVWDNDAVNGSKSARSEMMTFKPLTNKQLDSAIQKNARQINSGLSNGARQNEQLQQEMQSLQNKMLQSDQMDWQQKQSLKDLAKLQEQMKNNLEQTKKRFEEQMRQTEQSNLSEDLQEKQAALKEQMDNLLNKELQEQMRKLQELMQQMNKQQGVQQLQQMQEQNKLFSMDMERIQELMKKLELQMKMESLADKVEQMAQKQSELRQQTDGGHKPKEALAKEQQQLKNELNKALGKDMKEMKDLAAEMKQKQDLNKEEQQGEQASEQMQQSEQQLDQGNNSKASQSQSKAAQNLQDMANALRQKAGGMDAEEIEMNIRAVRQILTNLMRLSFDQEQLIQATRTTATNNPRYLSNIQKQNDLHQNSFVIRDSLFSLSKKLFKLSATINKETNQLEKNMRSSITSLEHRNVQDAASRQQYVMTHTNNLALMLNEILSNLIQQQSQAQKSQGSGQCSKPGGSTPKPGSGQQLSDIISKQKSLSGRMQQGKEGQKKEGEQQGKDGQKPGQGQGQGQGEQNGGGEQNARELMQLAQQQAAIRRQLALLNQKLNSEGNNNISKDLKEIQDQMDKNEADLVNRKLDQDFYRRQKEILNRMMETESSLREQEEDERRTSKNPEELSRPVPPELKKHLLENPLLKEQYRTVPPNLKPYYKQLNENYFKQVGQ